MAQPLPITFANLPIGLNPLDLLDEQFAAATDGAYMQDDSLPESALVSSGVPTGTYGDASHVGTFTVNSKGLLTSASSTAISIGIGAITGLGTGVATFLATPTSANLAAAVADETGTGALVFAGSPALTGTPTAPTATTGTNTTQLATTAFVLANSSAIAVKYVATRTAMAALAGATSPVVWLEEAGRVGMFQWSSANQSALVTADTLQTVCVPPSTDTTGASGAWVRPEYTERQWIDLSWSGALANGSDTTSAFNVCLAILAISPGAHGGTIHLGPGFWKGNWQMLSTGHLDVTIEGSSFDVNLGTVLEAFSNASPALLVGYTASSATFYNYCTFRNLFIASQGNAGALALDCYQSAGMVFENVSVSGGWRFVGSAGITVINCYAYGNGLGDPAVLFTNLNGTRENNGPIQVIGGEFAVQGTGRTGKALVIQEDCLALSFIGVQLYGVDGPVQIDGGSSANGSVSFIECHTESAYNATNTAANFLIGSVAKYGSVKIIGGNYWGQGNGTNYLQDWVRIVNAANVTLDSSIVSNLGNTHGFSRAAVRIESTFTGKLEVRNVNATVIEGAMYSDATGKIPAGYVGDVSNNNQWWDGVTSSTNYTQLPGGMQMCWGTATVGASYTAVTFPRAFSSTTGLIVTATPLGASSNTAASPVTGISTTGFSCASNLATTVTWMAIGPANP